MIFRTLNLDLATATAGATRDPARRGLGSCTRPREFPGRTLMFFGHFQVVSWIIGIKFVRFGLQYGSNL